MNYEKLSVTIEGVSPLLMHNAQLCNPLNPIVQEMKGISGKRKKTDEDYIELARLEFWGSLYLDSEKGPVIPGFNVEATIVEAAKKDRGGKVLAKSGIIVEDDNPLIYDGPRTVDELWANKNFVNVASARVQMARIMRCRPIFRQWSLKFELMYLRQVCTKSQIEKWLEIAGLMCAIGDWRPRFGRFVVVSVSE